MENIDIEPTAREVKHLESSDLWVVFVDAEKPTKDYAASLDDNPEYQDIDHSALINLNPPHSILEAIDNFKGVFPISHEMILRSITVVMGLLDKVNDGVVDFPDIFIIGGNRTTGDNKLRSIGGYVNIEFIQYLLKNLNLIEEFAKDNSPGTIRILQEKTNSLKFFTEDQLLPSHFALSASTTANMESLDNILCMNPPVQKVTVYSSTAQEDRIKNDTSNRLGFAGRSYSAVHSDLAMKYYNVPQIAISKHIVAQKVGALPGMGALADKKRKSGTPEV